MQDQKPFSIKNWAEGDRPREKLLQKGKMSLSDAELIAILIGSGSREESAVQLSKRILAASENKLNELGKLSVQQLTKFKGIGEAKAITIVAAMELGRRRRGEEAGQDRRGRRAAGDRRARGRKGGFSARREGDERGGGRGG